MAKIDPELEALKEELREVISKVKRRYAEMHFTSYDDPDFYWRVHRSSKNLITRVFNGTS